MLRAAALALLLPAAAAAQQASAPEPICTDRPAKAASACTVPAGVVQIETDILNLTRQDQGGARTDTILYTSPTLKYGVGASTDIEAAITPYVETRMRDANGASRIGGVGDLYLRVKQRLTAADAKAQFALLPYIKLPTAKTGIGNRRVEGGLAATGVFNLPAGFSLALTPEIDDLADADLHGRHAQLVGALNLGKSLSSKVTVNAELWGSRNYDPSATVTQYSADAAAAWQLTPGWQLDGGVNIGLNRETPGVQAYFGVSTRF